MKRHKIKCEECNGFGCRECNGTGYTVYISNDDEVVENSIEVEELTEREKGIVGKLLKQLNKESI